MGSFCTLDTVMAPAKRSGSSSYSYEPSPPAASPARSCTRATPP